MRSPTGWRHLAFPVPSHNRHGVQLLVLPLVLCLAGSASTPTPNAEAELHALQDSIWRWKSEHPADPQAANLCASAQMADHVVVNLIRADSAFRADFRRRVHDSQRIRIAGFDPPATPWPPAPDVPMDSETGVSIHTDRAFYPSGTECAAVTIRNNCGREVFFGEDYLVCRFQHGRWELLPSGGIFHSLLHGLHAGGEYRFHAWLAPQIYPARYGRYRIFKTVFSDPHHELLLMTEFTVTPFVPFTRFEKERPCKSCSPAPKP